ncbi:nuclear transport factor 2 family protein [Shewanella sp. 125m-7]
MFNFSASKALCILLLLSSSISINSLASDMPRNDKQQATMVLDALNQYSSTADWDNYFALYDEQGIFIGTDVNEHWGKVEFEQYARPTKGWRYDLVSRKMTQHGDVIWFDEILSSPSYGVSRGTGTLIKTNQGWKIAQYHLSFPIPNAIAKSITQQIKAADK